MISTTLQLKQSLIKAIYFDQFLELVNALSQLYYQKLFSVNPRRALKKLVGKFCALLDKVENCNMG